MSIQQHGLIDSEIPLKQYFLFVGGALLALLFVADAATPRQPTLESVNAGPRLPRIRIHSEQKGQEAIVFDTSQPTFVPTRTAREEAATTVASSDPHVAENVAQTVSPSPKQSVAKELRKMERKPQPRNNIGRAGIQRPPVSYAQRRNAGPFDGPWTFDRQDAHIRETFAQLVPRQQRQGGARREVAWARTGHARPLHRGWFDTGW
jgi:hypothetical protein